MQMSHLIEVNDVIDYVSIRVAACDDQLGREAD